MCPGEIPLAQNTTSSGETSTSVYPELIFCYHAVCVQEPIGNCNVPLTLCLAAAWELLTRCGLLQVKL